MGQAQLLPIFWGNWTTVTIQPFEITLALWNMGPDFTTVAQYGDVFLSPLISPTPFMVDRARYADPVPPTGSTILLNKSDSSAPTTPGTVPYLLTQLFRNGDLAANTSNIYVVYAVGGGGSGFHNQFTYNGSSYVYAVIGNPFQSSGDLENVTEATSEEVAEAMTDPRPFSGISPEIGDDCNTIPGSGHNEAGGATVQSFFSQDEGPSCVVSGEHATWAALEGPNTGSSSTAGFAAARDASGHLEAFAVGRDNQLWRTLQQSVPTLTQGVNPSVRWSSWSAIASNLQANTRVVAFQSPVDGHLEIYANLSSGFFLRAVQSGSGGWSTGSVAQVPGGRTNTFAVAANADGSPTALMVSSDGT